MIQKNIHFFRKMQFYDTIYTFKLLLFIFFF